jgi:hypothetical protein
MLYAGLCPAMSAILDFRIVPVVSPSIMIFSGNNPTEICQLCKGTGGTKCSTNDPSAGYDGAFRCLQKGDGDVAFLRHEKLDFLNNCLSFWISNPKNKCQHCKEPFNVHSCCFWFNHVHIAS